MPLEDIREARLKKLEQLKKAGVDPYPAKSWRSREIASALDDFDELAANRKSLVLVGRIMARRDHGGSTFLDVQDATGRIQSYFKKDKLGDRDYEFFLETVDIGDFVEVQGTPFRTKQNEPTLEVEKYRLLSKSLLPLPEKWHGLKDIEERLRKPYLDMIFNPEVGERFKLRTEIIRELRRFLDGRGFLEVETPVLQTIAGGALARPFKTKINALEMDVYLRVAPELFLKRLLIGGFEQVYEIGKNFRNEGIDRDHNPEFTELEFYAAYKDYEWLMKFTEELFEQVAAKIFGGSQIKYKDQVIDFKGPYRRVTFNDLLKKYSGLDYDETDQETLAKKAKALDVQIEKTMTKGNIADEIYKKVARPDMVQPTFVINHPLDISPLAKRLEKDPEHAARVQLVVGGHELTNCFSELNDPIDQRERFEAQRKAAKKGNVEAHPYDEDYIKALEYGLPPSAGFGLGVDRLVTILTDSHSIREVILFPLMKPSRKS